MRRRFIVCDGAELARLWARIGSGSSEEELTWVPREDESRARPAGFRALQGGLTAEAIDKLNPKEGDDFVLVTEEAPFARAGLSAVADALPAAPVLLMSDRIGADDVPPYPCLRRTGLRSLIRDDVERELDHLDNLRRVVRLRALLGERERVAILLQPDPDPDGIAAGVGLRALLARRSPSAPLVSFGEVKRPENRAMVEALGLEVKTIAPAELEEYDGLALVDVQPPVFGEPPPPRTLSVDAVIDHHPDRGGYEAAHKDIRPGYGATSTIVTEYLEAAGLELRPKLGTALLYGIKSDTQLLGRDTSRADLLAFTAVHAAHSPALLRRIERPALPRAGLRALGRALASTEVEDGIHLLVLGRVREDVIPQVADIGLQAEGAEWAVAAGVVGGDLVFSVRNVGWVRGAGDVVRAIVEGLGVGGGHRSMAKGIVPLKAFRAVHGRADQATIRRALMEAFRRATRGDESSVSLAEVPAKGR